MKPHPLCFQIVLIILSIAEGQLLMADDPEAEANVERRSSIIPSRATTFFVEPLARDGAVDYAAAINRKLRAGVAPERNAAVLLWKVFGPDEIPEADRERFFGMLGIEPLPESDEYFVRLSDFADERGMNFDEFFRRTRMACRTSWQAHQFPEVAEWLERNEGLFSALRLASRREEYYSPIFADSESEFDTALCWSLFDTMLLRDAVLALSAHSTLSVGRGNIDIASEDLAAAYRLTVFAGSNGEMASNMIQHRLLTDLTHSIEIFANSGLPIVEHARLLRATVESLRPLAAAADCIDVGGRCTALDGVVYLERNGFNSLNKPFAEVFQRMANQLADFLIDWNEVLLIVNRRYDECVAAARLPERSNRMAALQQFTDKLRERGDRYKKDGSFAGTNSIKGISQRMGELYVTKIFPEVVNFVSSRDQTETQRRMAILCLALAEFRAIHKNYPMELKELCPTILAELPHDAFHEEPFIYRRVGSGYLFYSIAANRLDDGGEDVLDNPQSDDLSVRNYTEADREFTFQRSASVSSMLIVIGVFLLLTIMPWVYRRRHRSIRDG